MGTNEAMKFIRSTREEGNTQKRLQQAFEKGETVSVENVVRIGAEGGFEFSTRDFQESMHKIIQRRYDAGDRGLEDLLKPQGALESACSRGCLSLTKTWHADGIILPDRS